MTKVAIVEDDAEIRKMLALTMQYAGYEVVSAGDGKRGLDIIIRERPQAVVLDVMMPGMSGFELCHAVKLLMGPQAPFVIMLTAKGQQTDVAAGLAHGADLYLIKPVDASRLLNHITDAIGKGENPAQAS
jgi:DNA-binding response OmpR family regulator